MKFTEFYRVLDRRIPRQDSDRKVLADLLNPTALANRAEPESHSLVEGFRSDFGRVLDSLSIADRDATGPPVEKLGQGPSDGWPAFDGTRTVAQGAHKRGCVMGLKKYTMHEPKVQIPTSIAAKCTMVAANRRRTHEDFAV